MSCSVKDEMFSTADSQEVKCQPDHHNRQYTSFKRTAGTAAVISFKTVFCGGSLCCHNVSEKFTHTHLGHESQIQFGFLMINFPESSVCLAGWLAVRPYIYTKCMDKINIACS